MGVLPILLLGAQHYFNYDTPTDK